MEPAQVYTKPLIGDQFPEMTVHSTLGELVLPTSCRGHWFLLFSHPGDFTTDCTTEFDDFKTEIIFKVLIKVNTII